jgi:trans-aconitate 2-methyltransferase
MASVWSPETYDRFRAERTQPFHDLLALVRRGGSPRVVDLGCGTGELTAEVHRTLAARETLGIDSSETMLARAASFAEPCLRFELGDISDFSADAAWDVVFSNAALQWAGPQEPLLARLARALRPGGQLAVQVPANHDHPSHVLAHALADEEPYRSALESPVPTSPVLAPEGYAKLLHALGFEEQHVRLQVYPHVLGGPADVIEWVRGTKLTAFQKRLPAALWPAFLDAYRQRVMPALGVSRPYFYPFKRILLWGRLPE